MIIKQETLDKIRIHINNLIHDSSFGGALQTATYQRALEVAVREAFAKTVERMELSDDEEMLVQRLEKETTNVVHTIAARKMLTDALKILRTRHEKRTIRRSAGRVLHEAFHTLLNKKGESRYGDGCWDQLSPSRQEAWEAASKELATQVMNGTTSITDTAGRLISVVGATAFPWRR